jgi:cellulose synthase/poly-beta-1,6-N-acetylglucosamine synthase-like glycosyltransferase
MGVTIILPAHNEEKIIKQAIESLLNQSYWHSEIIVCLDNCTDNTEKILNDNFGENFLIKIFKSVNNQNKKAGALNQLFNYHFKNMRKYILVMDADTILHHKAVEEGVRYLARNCETGAVCSMAGTIEPKNKNLLWYLQNIEYGFGDTSFIENQGNVFVCRGMYSMYRKMALENVIKKRNTVYNVDSITEDYDLTLVLKQLGYKLNTSNRIKAFTETPATFKEYFIQRKRWIKGGTDDLIRHGYKKYTALDINNMLFYFLLMFVQVIFAIEAVKVHNFDLIWLLIIIIVYYINAGIRSKYIKNKDWKMYLILFSMIPVCLYSILNNILYIYGTTLSLLKIKIEWR